LKTVLLLLDGLGDRPHSILNGHTPLEAANTPNLDKLCKNAQTGIMIPYKQGVPLGTEVSHFVLFGYDIEKFPGRGIINALSRDFNIEKNAVYLCTSWAWVEEEDGLSIKERWTKDISDDEVSELKKILPAKIDGISFEWHQSVECHGVLKLEGENMSSDISDSDPFYDNSYVMKVEEYDTKSKNAVYTAEAVNKYLLEAHRRLKEHDINIERVKSGKQPANFLLTKWTGEKPHILSFEEMHGMKSCIIGDSLLMYGISRLLGMDYIKYDSFKNGVDLAIKSDYEFIHLHTKKTDEAAHTKNPLNKVKVIEEIDEQLDELVQKAINKEILLIVTGDHTTPSSGRMIHSGEPVPIMFIGENVRVDDVDVFGERNCSKGSIRMYGSDLMQMILNFTDRAQFYNFRAGSRKINHIPKNINKLY